MSNEKVIEQLKWERDYAMEHYGKLYSEREKAIKELFAESAYTDTLKRNMTPLEQEILEKIQEAPDVVGYAKGVVDTANILCGNKSMAFATFLGKLSEAFNS